MAPVAGNPPSAAPLSSRMNDPASPARSAGKSSARPLATAIRYLAIAVGCACLLLAAACFVIACQVYIQTGVFAQSYAIVCLISGAMGWLAILLARVWK
jgi:hypothetical protein